MTLLSAVIITFNEEQHIQRCIRSVRQVADEVIVVDSFSKDNTKRICLDEGVVFIEHAFEGYGLQKNFAVSSAHFDYVLNLDADEFLSEKLTAALLGEKANGFRYDAYLMNRLNRYRGQWIRHGSWYPDRKLRLYNRLKGKWSDKLVHEDVEMEPGSTRTKLQGDLMHFAYETIDEHEAKNEKYSSLSARVLHENGRKVYPVSLILNPAWAFFLSFIIRRGFLDGWNGFVIARKIASLSYMKFNKVLAMQKEPVSSQ